eukprot:3875468-Prymnesium_polylepis.1
MGLIEVSSLVSCEYCYKKVRARLGVSHSRIHTWMSKHKSRYPGVVCVNTSQAGVFTRVNTSPAMVLTRYA